MIKQGIKHKGRITNVVNPQKAQHLKVNSNQILEIHFKLNWLQQTFKDTYLNMKENELKDKKFEVIYYEYNEETGVAKFQIKPKESNIKQTALGFTTAQLVTISIISISTAFFGYFGMTATKYIFREDKGVTWKDVASLALLGLSLNKLIERGK